MDGEGVGVPRLLDLFCGAGGCARGYQEAGFHVTGVDIKPQPRYAGDVFVQGDALEYVAAHGHEFDAIHASPPCQRYAGITKVSGKPEAHPDLIAPTRAALVATERPYVIENVADAKGELINPLLICGSMFDPPMAVQRHRLFEANWYVAPPMWPCRHKLWGYRFPNPDKRGRGLSRVIDVEGHLRYAGQRAMRERAMGIDWMAPDELTQAIPPAYTRFIGEQLLRALGAERQAA